MPTRCSDVLNLPSLITVYIMVMFTACAEDPLPKFMDKDTTSRIIISQSTEADVREILGHPQQIRTAIDQTNSTTIWLYQYIRRGTYELIPALREKLSEPALRSVLSIHFNNRHIVEKMERMDQEIRSPEEGGILMPF